MSTTLTVTGMTCTGCENAVVDALTSVDGVTGATADHETETATAEGDADPLDLIAAVQDAGYEADV